MSAVEALSAARAAGVTVALNGENLVLEANAEPPQAVLDVLAHHKRAIVALLRSGQYGWTAEDWRARWDELRVKAEIGAFNSCIAEWLNRNPSPSPAGCWRAWHQSRRREEAAIALRRMGIAIRGSLGDHDE